MSRALVVAAAVALLSVAAGCRIPAAYGPDTESERHIPIMKLSEDQDEWLHGHCAYRGLGIGAAGASTASTKVADANLAEILYEHNGGSDLAVFACRTSPPFIVGVLLAPVEERAPSEPASPPAAVARAPEPSAPSAPVVSEPALSVAPPQPEAPPRLRPLAPYGTVALVAGVAGLAAGTVTGLMAMSAASDVHAHCDGNRVCDSQGLDATSKGPTLATVSTACFVGGGVLAAAGIVLLALPGTPVKVGPAPQGLGLNLQGAF